MYVSILDNEPNDECAYKRRYSFRLSGLNDKFAWEARRWASSQNLVSEPTRTSTKGVIYLEPSQLLYARLPSHVQVCLVFQRADQHRFPLGVQYSWSYRSS
jgi:hypothetical protein